jgi:lactoylglutathione lyase
MILSKPTQGFVMNQTMLRIKDPAASVPFYRDVMGMTLLDRYDFSGMKFSLYFMGYPGEPVPEARAARIKWVFEQPA